MVERLRELGRRAAKEGVELGLILVVIIVFSHLFLGAKLWVPLVAVTSCSMYHANDPFSRVLQSCPARSEDWEKWFIEHGFVAEVLRSFPMREGFSRGDIVVVAAPSRGLLNLYPELRVGDVIVFERDKLSNLVGKEPIIHRVIGVVEVKNWKVSSVEGTLDCLGSEELERLIAHVQGCLEGKFCYYTKLPKSGSFRIFLTRGDNNPSSDPCSHHSFPGFAEELERACEESRNACLGFKEVPIALPVLESQVLGRGLLRVPFLGWIKILLPLILLGLVIYAIYWLSKRT